MGNTKNSTATTPNATSMPDATPQNSLIYGLDDRPPLREALFAALQHLLAIFVAIITPPLIIAGALQADIETTSTLVSTALIASGISTFIQCRRIGPVGCGLPASKAQVSPSSAPSSRPDSQEALQQFSVPASSVAALK